MLTLTLNRPEKKNALTREMYQALGDAIDGAGGNAAVRCILIQAEGDLFTAGNDLGDFAAINRAEPGGSAPRLVNPLLAALVRTLDADCRRGQRPRRRHRHDACCCTATWCSSSDDAVLTTPFVNLALVPEAASSLLLPARIGHARAFAMFVLGEAVDAKTAVNWGIANAVCPRAELRARARAAADAIAARPASAVRLTKSLMRDPAALTARMEIEGAHFGAQLKSAEAREAFAAFAEKRAPDFSKL